MWDAAAETMDRVTLGGLQLARLQDVVSGSMPTCPSTVSAWTRRRSSGGYPLSEDIQRIPFTLKDDMRAAYPYGMFAAPAEGYCTHPRIVRHDRPFHGGGLHEA